MVILSISNCAISSSKVLPIWFAAKEPHKGMIHVHSHREAAALLDIAGLGQEHTGGGSSTGHPLMQC